MKATIAIMGPTGAGKDTQARLLAEQYQYQIISAGDEIRHLAQTDQIVRDVIAHGDLADDKLVNDIIGAKIDRLKPHQRIVCDGFPRVMEQAEWFDQYLAEVGRQLEGIIYLQLDPTTSLARLGQRGRIDDQTAVIQQRLAVFESVTRPVIEHYAGRGLVHQIKADQPIDAIHAQIIEYLS